jgi:hypothetical protein
MRVVLPVGAEMQQVPDVICRGHIVRILVKSEVSPQPALAATITKYRIRGATSH